MSYFNVSVKPEIANVFHHPVHEFQSSIEVQSSINNKRTWPRGYETFFILDAEHKIYPAYKC